MPGWVPRADRESVSVEATVRLHGCAVPVTVTDISKCGCKVRSPQALPIGEVVQLELSAVQPQAADVRWSLAGLAGLRFV